MTGTELHLYPVILVLFTVFFVYPFCPFYILSYGTEIVIHDYGYITAKIDNCFIVILLSMCCMLQHNIAQKRIILSNSLPAFYRHQNKFIT